MKSNLCQVARKEIVSYFASPIAFIFLGTFLLINLFIFFWVEKFFSRNITDVRPLFEWMPILLIFLVASLTMRMWSEERRSGTLEFLLTLPVSACHLVFGKFLACLALVALALVLTVPVPITVAFLGDLDWGPVFGAYLASIFLAGAYIAIGLYVSSKNSNQIVSLIITVLISLLFFLLGSKALTPFFGNQGSEFMKLLGTGSRFDSITRGVIDLRDIYYYLSLVGLFASLNIFALEKIRWSTEAKHQHHRVWHLCIGLFIVNFIVANFWLHKVNFARVDVTQGSIYSISDATRGYLDQLQEPLLIRGYFSAKTHPLLAPLVPRLRDLIREYQIAGGSKVRSEFIDPRENPELEEEANRKYSIKPIPFQISDKYQSSLVNSYFDILIKYGDKFEVLNFRDLIDVSVRGESEVDVQLRNPEYDLTRSIKKVLYGFQGTDHLFASLSSPVRFQAYISADTKLPDSLQAFRKELQAVLDEFKASAGDKFEVAIDDPEAGDAQLAKEIEEKYGFRPMVAGVFSRDTFYFYMTLMGKEQVIQVPFPENLDQDGLKTSISAALKRFSVGYLKTVGLYTPPMPQTNPYMQQMGMGPTGKQFQMLREKISQNYNIKRVDFKNGTVPNDIDLLVVAAPEDFTDQQVFALDQFLMKGGTIVLATSRFGVARTNQSLKAQVHNSGIDPWLDHHGITLENEMVLDAYNENYPVPVQRNLGGLKVQEIKLVPYPHFVDVRSDGMNRDNAIASGIPQLTMNWVSPIVFDDDKNANRKIIKLLHSSEESWASPSKSIIPDFTMFGSLGFPKTDKQEAHLLAAIVEGKFDSFFKDKESPILEAKQREEKKKEEEAAKNPQAPPEADEEEEPLISSIIDKSPESARLIVFASNEFLTDQALRISASMGSSRYLNSLQIIENSLDWSVEDRGLLSIRSRGQFSRTLVPLERSEQIFWEYLNYALALIGLFIVFLIYRVFQRKQQLHYQRILNTQGA